MDGLLVSPAVVSSVPEVLAALDRMEKEISNARNFEALLKIMRTAEAIGVQRRDVKAVKDRSGKVVVKCRRVIGLRLKEQPKAKGTRGRLPPGPGRGHKRQQPDVTAVSGDEPATLEQLVGSKMGAHRAKKLADHSEEEIEQVVEALARADIDITEGAVIKAFAAEETAKKREASRTAPRLANGMEMRIGDARKVLADIPDNSIPLILTDPPYGDEAEPLYIWLAEFAARVLIPGGSLICYTGQSRLDRDMRILGAQLRYWWLLAMLHDQSQRFPGKFVIAGFKPVMWFVKEKRRGRSLVPDLLKPPRRDKELHNWGQGEGGIPQLVEHLTEPAELIIDPFAGTGEWGHICAGMGRRWIGADIVQGGTATVRAS